MNDRRKNLKKRAAFKAGIREGDFSGRKGPLMKAFPVIQAVKKAKTIRPETKFYPLDAVSPPKLPDSSLQGEAGTREALAGFSDRNKRNQY